MYSPVDKSRRQEKETSRDRGYWLDLKSRSVAILKKLYKSPSVLSSDIESEAHLSYSESLQWPKYAQVIRSFLTENFPINKVKLTLPLCWWSQFVYLQ